MQEGYGSAAVGTAEPASAVDLVVVRIRARIDQGELVPGARLVERRVAADLGVSHIPVREALARLEEEGLVERLPRRGARVAALTARSLEETVTLRVVLERFVVARVRERLDPAAEARLAAIVETMVAAAGAGDADAVLDADRRFHALLWELSGHELLLDVTARLRGRMNRFLRLATRALPPADLRAHALSHRDLLAAITGPDAERAGAAMQAHVEEAARRIAAAAGIAPPAQASG